MAKILAIGDPHLKINHFDLSKRFLEWITSIIQQQKPDLIVNLGDTFDNHAVLRSEIMTEFMKHVDVARAVAPYIYLIGNHDQFKPNDSKYHALSHLRDRVDNFIIIDKTTNLHGITFVPYCHNPNLFPKETSPICIAHQLFKGADYGNITTKDGVDSSCLIGTEIIISGHIHKRQRLDNSRSKGPEVFYVGSPFALSASDINQIKGVSIIDTATYEETFIQCPLPMWRGDKFIIEPNFTTNDMHHYLSANLPRSKDHWVIDITGPKAEIINYLKSQEYKTMIENVDVKIKTSFTDKEKRQIRIESLSIENIISQYVTKVYSGSLDKKLLIEKAIEILRLTK